ncbi:MAG: hypothetical protein U9N86_08185 [Bacteroidota bacterium]|nr:hypothetical protein [Bacteroidota bacterium]
MRFKSNRTYYFDGYRLSHSGCWKLSYKSTLFLTEADKDFWQIVSMYDFKPFEVIDFIGDDSRPTEFITDETDHNFLPSLGRDFGSDEKVERIFPIWEWNEYIDTSLMSKYKVG